MKTELSASLLSADFNNLSSELKKVENSGVKYLHYDVMDGVFVPNISFGIPVLKNIKSTANLIFDVHLMIVKPLLYIEEFSNSGADLITFHVESDDNPLDVIEKIKKCEKKVGISIKPNTPCEAILPYLELIDLVLVMSVEPGFGGQSFIENSLEKISFLKKYITENNLNVNIEVDGGINEKNAKKVISAGADILVAGSYLFGNDDMSEAAKMLLD